VAQVFRIFYTRQGLTVSRVKKSSYLASASESQASEGTGCALSGVKSVENKLPTAACDDDDGFQTRTENLRNGKNLLSSNRNSNTGTTIIISTPFPHSMGEVSLMFCVTEDRQRTGLVGAKRPLYTGALGDG
jgi:hypothetical protein